MIESTRSWCRNVVGVERRALAGLGMLTLWVVGAACGARSALLDGGSDGSGASAISTSAGVGGASTSSGLGVGGGGTGGKSKCVGPGAIAFASGPEWGSFVGEVAADGSVGPALGMSLGPAREVCLDANDPTNCPAGAVIYGLPTNGWHGGSGLANAHWIWKGDVSPSQPADLVVAAFEKTFVLCPKPSGSIAVSVDDYAEVFVNGVALGEVGSITDPAVSSAAQNAPTTFDLTCALDEGTNTIVVVGRNGPASFAGCGGSGCTYAHNPAGVVFAGTLSWPAP